MSTIILQALEVFFLYWSVEDNWHQLTDTHWILKADNYDKCHDFNFLFSTLTHNYICISPNNPFQFKIVTFICCYKMQLFLSFTNIIYLLRFRIKGLILKSDLTQNHWGITHKCFPVYKYISDAITDFVYVLVQIYDLYVSSYRVKTWECYHS